MTRSMKKTRQPALYTSVDTAALATANRIGAGKRMKHMDTQMFYVQGLGQGRRLKTKKQK